MYVKLVLTKKLSVVFIPRSGLYDGGVSKYIHVPISPITAVTHSSSPNGIIADLILVLLGPIAVLEVLEDVAAFIETEFPIVVAAEVLVLLLILVYGATMLGH